MTTRRAVSAHRIAVAYSGGRDSTALLHATIVQARAAGVAVIALHVQHGLSAHAEAWWRHCDAQCAEWASAGLPVVFAGHRVVERPAAGESVEAWARAARYRALRELALANDARVVLLAHHRRDQAETWLLQALRGAGTAGLSAMPERAQRQGIVWERPWLARPREAIEAYLQQHGLRYIDDDSNADQRHARNRLRLQVWPALTAAFPHTETALATAARWAQQAGDALDELAQIDLARIADDAGLHLAAWLALSEARRSNALRAWLATVLPTAAPAALTLRLLDELPHGRAARWPVPAGELRMYRGVLTHARHEPHHAEQSASHAGLQRETMLAILEAGAYRLPGWGGVLHAERVRAHGVPVAWLIRLELRERRGDQRFQMGIGRPPRSLKKQFQQVGIPAWQREGPLVYSGDQLLFVPGLGLDARVLGVPGQVLAGLRWVGDGEAGGAPKAAG